MSLITCQDCDNKVSDSAISCPNCGKPTSEDPQLSQVDKKKIKTAKSKGEKAFFCLVGLLGVIMMALNINTAQPIILFILCIASFTSLIWGLVS